MCRTLDQLIVEIKKLILLPFKIGSGMWALVVISKELAIFMHNKNRPGVAFYLKLEAFAAGIFDISGFAE